MKLNCRIYPPTALHPLQCTATRVSAQFDFFLYFADFCGVPWFCITHRSEVWAAVLLKFWEPIYLWPSALDLCLGWGASSKFSWVSLMPWIFLCGALSGTHPPGGGGMVWGACQTCHASLMPIPASSHFRSVHSRPPYD